MCISSKWCTYRVKPETVIWMSSSNTKSCLASIVGVKWHNAPNQQIRLDGMLGGCGTEIGICSRRRCQDCWWCCPCSHTGSKEITSLCQNVFLPYIECMLQDVVRIDVVWDTYVEDSLKAQTRMNRGSGNHLRVSNVQHQHSCWLEELPSLWCQQR